MLLYENMVMVVYTFRHLHAGVQHSCSTLIIAMMRYLIHANLCVWYANLSIRTGSRMIIVCNYSVMTRQLLV